MKTIKDLLKKPVVIIGTLFTILVLVIKVLLGKNKDLTAVLKGTESDKKDAVLEQQQKDLAEQQKKDLAALEQEKGRKLSDQEMEDFLKKL